MTEEDGRHQVCHSRASLLLRAVELLDMGLVGPE